MVISGRGIIRNVFLSSPVKLHLLAEFDILFAQKNIVFAPLPVYNIHRVNNNARKYILWQIKSQTKSLPELSGIGTQLRPAPELQNNSKAWLTQDIHASISTPCPTVSTNTISSAE
jgi:hypothetical protein